MGTYIISIKRNAGLRDAYVIAGKEEAEGMLIAFDRLDAEYGFHTD